VRERGEIRCRDLVAAIGVSRDHSYVLVNQMRKAGQLKQLGERMHYRYSLP
jgi:hypothetical protein